MQHVWTYSVILLINPYAFLVSLEAWITVLVNAYLSAAFAERKDEWMMFAGKYNWRKYVPEDIHDTVTNEAEEIFKKLSVK